MGSVQHHGKHTIVVEKIVYSICLLVEISTVTHLLMKIYQVPLCIVLLIVVNLVEIMNVDSEKIRQMMSYAVPKIVM